MLIYGKEIREKIKARVREQVNRRRMNMAIIQVGDEQPSEVYVRNIRKFAEETGVGVDIFKLSTGITQSQLLKIIKKLNRDSDVTGIMLQRPLPDNLNSYLLVNSIDANKDVEGVHNFNLGKLISLQKGVRPSTPKAVMTMLKEHNLAIEGKKVVIVGRSTIVGSPLASMMTAENATVTVCHSRTINLADETRQADILVAAIGKPGFITADMIKEGAILMDAGINFTSEGKMVGDIHQEAKDKASFASAVPGGVGVITVAELFDNLCILSEQNSEK